MIARNLGCSREAVRQARERTTSVQAESPRQRTLPTAQGRIAEMDTVGMTVLEVAEKAGCEEKHALDVMRVLGKTFKRRPRGGGVHDWSKFPADWRDLTDKQIADVVGVGDPAVMAQWRNRHGYRKNSVVRQERVVVS